VQQVLAVFISLLMLSLLGLSAHADIKGARLWHAPDHSRLVFDLSKDTEHKIFELNNPSRLVIDLEQTQAADHLNNLDTGVGPVRKVRWAKRHQTDLRIVLDLRHPVNPKSFQLRPNGQYGHRLVVDLFEAGKETATPDPVPVTVPVINVQDTLKTKRDVVIAIDAGHGGEDPGAIGHGRVYEKTVVLAIARELASLLEAEQGFTPHMIRSGDYYIRLRDRTKAARRANADLFVSVHADAFSSPQAKGGSVFALSQRGATSEAARWLADKENAADLIGGVGGVSLDDKEELLAGVLLDLSMTASLGVSLDLGKMVLSSMGQVARLHKHHVEQAGFAVLKSPDVPSILIETGFLSNPSEARKLSTRAYQRQMARAIFTGIKQYFSQSPPPGTYLAALNQQSRALREYIIAPGDTLSLIAQKHGIAMADLRELNGLKNDSIRVGQILKIPTT